MRRRAPSLWLAVLGAAAACVLLATSTDAHDEPWRVQFPDAVLAARMTPSHLPGGLDDAMTAPPSMETLRKNAMMQALLEVRSDDDEDKLPKIIPHIVSASPVAFKNTTSRELPNLEAVSAADLAKVERECPRAACPANFTCPFDGGVCCHPREGQDPVCCPSGQACLNTNPPVCVRDEVNSTHACTNAYCKPNFFCPYQGVELCCIGGETCCAEGYKCHANGPNRTNVYCKRLNDEQQVEKQRQEDHSRYVLKLEQQRDVAESRLKNTQEAEEKDEQIQKNKWIKGAEERGKKVAKAEVEAGQKKIANELESKKAKANQLKKALEEKEKAKLNEAKIKTEKAAEQKKKFEDGVAYRLNEPKSSRAAAAVNKNAEIALRLSSGARFIGGALKIVKPNTKGNGCATSRPSARFNMGTNSFTIIVRVLSNARGPHKRVITQREKGKSAWYSLVLENGKPHLELADGLFVKGYTDVADGEWHTVAAVRDASTKQLLMYVNGRLEGRAREPSTTDLSSTSPLMLGCWLDEAAGGSNFFGLIRDAQLVKRAMTEEEIVDHANDALSKATGKQLLAVHDREVSEASRKSDKEEDSKKAAEATVKENEKKAAKAKELKKKQEFTNQLKQKERKQKQQLAAKLEEMKKREQDHKKEMKRNEAALKAKQALEASEKRRTQERERRQAQIEAAQKKAAEDQLKHSKNAEKDRKKVTEVRMKASQSAEASAKKVAEERGKYRRAQLEAAHKAKLKEGEDTTKRKQAMERTNKANAKARLEKLRSIEASEKQAQEARHKGRVAGETARKAVAEQKLKLSKQEESQTKKVEEEKWKLAKAQEADGKKADEEAHKGKGKLEASAKRSSELTNKRTMEAEKKKEASFKLRQETAHKRDLRNREKSKEHREKTEQRQKRATEENSKQALEKNKAREHELKKAEAKRQADLIALQKAREVGAKKSNEVAHKRTKEAGKKAESLEGQKKEEHTKKLAEQKVKTAERLAAEKEKQKNENALKHASNEGQKKAIAKRARREADLKKRDEAKNKKFEEQTAKDADAARKANENKSKGIQETKQKAEKRAALNAKLASQKLALLKVKQQGEQVLKVKQQAAEASAKRAQQELKARELAVKRVEERERKKGEEMRQKKVAVEERQKKVALDKVAESAAKRSSELKTKEADSRKTSDKRAEDLAKRSKALEQQREQAHKQTLELRKKEHAARLAKNTARETHLKKMSEMKVKQEHALEKRKEQSQKREIEEARGKAHSAKLAAQRRQEIHLKRLAESKAKSDATLRKKAEASAKALAESGRKKAAESSTKAEARKRAEQQQKAAAAKAKEQAHKAAIARERHAKAVAAEQRRKSHSHVFHGGVLKPRRGYALRSNAHIPKSHTYSYAFWYKPVGVYHTWTNVLHKGSHDRHRAPSVYQYPGSTRLHLRLGSSGGWNTGADPGHHLPLFRWTHVAFTVTKGRFRVYYNGHMVHNGGYHFPHVNSGPLFTSNPWYVSARVYLADLRYAAGELSHGAVRTLFGQRRYKDFTAHFVWITGGTIRPRRGWVIRHVNHMPDNVGAFTLTLWVRPIHNIGSWGSLYHQGNTNTARLGGTLWFYPGSSRLHMRSSTYKHWNDGLDPGQHLPHHRWTHVAIRHWWGMMEVYYNGHRVAAAGRAGPIGHRGHVYTGDPWHHTGVAYLADIRYYWDGLLSHAQIRGIMNQRRHANIPTFAWRTIYSRVCFHARGGYGTFYISGAHQIKAFRLRYLSGWVSCAGVGRHAHLRSHWGCDGRSTSLSVIITDNHGNGREVSPRGGVRGYSRHHHSWFKLSGATANSPTLTFWQTNGLAYQTGNGRHAMRLYYLESLKRYTLGDNAGATCARVEGYMT